MRRPAAIAALLLVGLSSAPAYQVRVRLNVLVISMDTTRADALSCYGKVPGIDREIEQVTPNLDALAARGSRFASAWAHAPTTLSSHASLFTGKDPHGHAVVRNGFALEEGHGSVVERFEAEGFDTLAVVGAAALESEMGLARGFRLYDDKLGNKFGPMIQDRADRVVERTLALVDQRDTDKPLFLFTHFYDPHAPYGAPGDAQFRFLDPNYTGALSEPTYGIRPFKQALLAGTALDEDIDAAASLYLGEVAYMDAQIGVLLAGLEERGLLENTFIVVTADHGEVLHERPPYAYSHGHDVFPESLHVPLIIAGPGLPQGRVVQRQVELAGIAPTLEALLGWTPTVGDKRDFRELLALGPVRDRDGWPERPTRTVLMEATRAPVDHPKWNNLDVMRGIRAGGFELRAWPARFEEPALVGADEDALVPVLADQLRIWDDAAPPHREESMSAATREALKALGYLVEEDTPE